VARRRKDGASGTGRDAYMLALGQRIRSLREARSLTQSECGERCGVGADVLSRLENGRYTNPGLRTLIRVAESLAVKPSELLPDSPDPAKHNAPQARLHALLSTAGPAQLELIEDLTLAVLKNNKR
jgi:transcriptional regulator with XRE-family HTH domain